MANKTRAELKNLWINGTVMNQSSGNAVFDDVWDSHFNLGVDGLQEVYEKTGGTGGTLDLSVTYGALFVGGDQDITLSSTDPSTGGEYRIEVSSDSAGGNEGIRISVNDNLGTNTINLTLGSSGELEIASDSGYTAGFGTGGNNINFSSDYTKIGGLGTLGTGTTSGLRLEADQPVEVRDSTSFPGNYQRVKAADPTDPEDLATKDYVDSTILPGTGDVISDAPLAGHAKKVAVYSNLNPDKFHIRETPATIDPSNGDFETMGDIESTAGHIEATLGNIIATAGDIIATAGNVTVGNNLDLSATDTIVSSAGNIDITTLPSHIADTANPHATSIANIDPGTRAELEAAVSDVTTFVVSGDAATGDLSGTYPDPTVSKITNIPVGTISAGSYLYSDGSQIIGLPAVSGPPSGSAGGDLNGTYPNPEVTDLTITNEVQGSILYFNGGNWVQLSPGTAGQVLQTGGALANPSWAASAAGGNVSYVAGTVSGTTDLAVFNGLGTQITNSATPLVVDLGSGAINEVQIIDGHITLKDNTGSEPVHEEGRIYYANGAFNAYIDEADITLQIGQEFWVKVKNGITGPTQVIANGQAVYIDTSDIPTGLPKVLLADASSPTANRVLGIATHDIDAGGEGYITTAGIVRGLNTSGTGIDGSPADGATVYLSESTPGKLTTVEPEAPNFPVVVGTIINAAGTAGTLFVQLTETIKTNDIGGDGGFNVGNVKALADGDILSYNLANQRFENIVPSGGGSITTGNTFYVDTTASGSGTPDDPSDPYPTIAAAIAAPPQSGDVIIVAPGHYDEEGLTIPDGVALVGTGGWGQTFIGKGDPVTKTASGGTQDVLTINEDTYVNGFSIFVPESNNSAIFANQPGGTNGVYNVNFYGNGTNTSLGTGFYRSGGGKTIGANIRCEKAGMVNIFRVDAGVLALEGLHVPASPGDITNVLLVERNASLLQSGRAQMALFNTGNSNVENAINIQGGTGTTPFPNPGGNSDKPVALIFNANIFNCENAVSSDGKYQEVSVIGGRIENVTYAVEVTAAPGTLSDVEAAAAKFRLSANHQPDYFYPPESAQYSDFVLNYSQETTDEIDASFNIFGNEHLSVGFPERGTLSHFGKGRPYLEGMQVWTGLANASAAVEAATSLVDVTADARSKSGSTFTFASNSTNECIFVGSARELPAGKLKFWGLDMLITAGEVAPRGEYVFERWDGGAWTPFDVFCTSTVEGYSYGNDCFWRTNSQEKLRFALDSDSVWDISTIGTASIDDLYWIRIRIASSPGTLPAFETIKLLESSFNVSKNGVASSTGLSQFRKNISLNGPIWTGLAGGGGGALGDYSETVGPAATPNWTHQINNSVMDSLNDAVMIQFPIPIGTCTAFPIDLYLIYEIINATPGDQLDPIPATGNTNELDIQVLPLEVSGNLVADPTGLLLPAPRENIDTLKRTNNVPPVPIQEELGLGLIPEGAALTTLFSDVLEKTHKIKLISVDVSDYYEEDLISMRIEFSNQVSGSQIVVWSLIAEGVSHQDGKGI